MIFRRIVLASLIVGAMTLVGAPLTVSAAHAEASQAAKPDSAQTFIEGLAEEAINALTAEGVTRAARIAPLIRR